MEEETIRTGLGISRRFTELWDPLGEWQELEVPKTGDILYPDEETSSLSVSVDY